VAVDASGTFSETKRQVGLLRLLQGGVIASDYATLMVEILKENALPEAGELYQAMDMGWAKLDCGLKRLLGRQARLQPTLRLTKYSVPSRRLQTSVHLSPSSYIKRLTARNSLSTTRSETRIEMS
jgi:hypothetical protein